MRELLVVQGKGWTKLKEEDGQAGIILGRLANAMGKRSDLRSYAEQVLIRRDKAQSPMLNAGNDRGWHMEPDQGQRNDNDPLEEKNTPWIGNP